MKPQIAHTVFDGKYLCLSVQVKLQRLQIGSYDLQAVFQIVFARMDQPEIIHIPSVELNDQLVLDHLVHPVQIQQGKSLIDLIAQRNPFAGCAVYEQVTQPADIRIPSEVIVYNVLQLWVGDAVEEFRYIALEDISFRAVSLIKL